MTFASKLLSPWLTPMLTRPIALPLSRSPRSALQPAACSLAGLRRTAWRSSNLWSFPEFFLAASGCEDTGHPRRPIRFAKDEVASR